MKIPSAYADGISRGRAVDPERTANYVAHTTVGDPLADAMIADLSAFSQEQSSELVRLCIEGGDDNALRSAPSSVREFYEDCTQPPGWLDLSSFMPGCRMFHRNTRIVLAGMLGGVLVEGFASNIAKSFFITGRLRDAGVRRLKQNNRHMVEIFMPDGLQRYGDGWKVSVRVRLIHAKIRHLLSKSDEWDTGEWGIPISSAHLGFAISAFSARLLRHIRRLGASFNEEERRSFMAIWRYSGHLMGIPESILFRDEADALEIFKIGCLCEPPPSMESIVLASSLVNSAPLFVHQTGENRRKLVRYILQVSRALIGDDLADGLKYPKQSTLGVLWKFRMLNRIEPIVNRLNPKGDEYSSNLTAILDVSMYDTAGIGYKLPDHVYAERSSKW